MIKILIAILFTFNVFAGYTPTTIKPQNGVKETSFNFEAPNNLATRTANKTFLLESGNSNILTNPSFEHSTVADGWTNTGTTSVISSETSVVINGKKSLKFESSSETVNLVQSSTLYASQFADGVQGLASIRVKTSRTTGCSVCSVQAGTVSTTNCQPVRLDGKWGLYKLPMILGATSNGISLACLEGIGDLYVDDAFVGAVDLKADVDQSRIAGESYFAGTTNCQWSRTNTAIGAFGTDADCPGPTIVVQNMGSWQTTDSDLPRQTINNLPAGTYKATFFIPTEVTIASISAFAINDGTTTCEAVKGNDSATSSIGISVSCTFKYASAGNRVFEVYGASSAGSIRIQNQVTSPRTSTKFILEYFGSGSVYSSTNADTDWASCGHTTSDFTGFGTVTGIETQCKREGSDLLMRGKFTSGTDSAVEARLNLKLGGSALTSANSPTIGSLQVVGHGNVSTASTTFFSGISILIEPSVGYATFGRESSTTDGITKTNANNIATSGRVISLNARIPISGWTQSNLIIGQFNGLESCTDSYECTDTFSATVSSTGVVTNENVNWINGNCSMGGTSSATASCTYISGLVGNGQNLTTNMNCFFNQDAQGSLVHHIYGSGWGTNSSTGFSARGLNNSGVDTAAAFNVICQKQGADYIGKTAKAVASDQNIATPGVTKVKACYYAFGGASATLASPTNCTTGTCTELYDTCGTGSVAFATTGAYTVTFSSGTFANTVPINCHETNGNGTNSIYIAKGPDAVSNSSGGFSYTYFTYIAGGTTLTNTRGVLKCEGNGP